MIRFFISRAAFIVILAVFNGAVFAQSQNYSYWQLSGLTGGKFVIAANESRTVSFSVTAVRLLNPNGPAGEYLPVNFEFRLFRLPKGTNIPVPISQSYTITTSDFAAQENSVTKQFTANVSAASGSSTTGELLRTDDRIQLITSGPWAAPDNFLVTVTAPRPAAPTNLIAVAADYNLVNLGWNDNSGNEDGFVLYRSTNPTSGFVPINDLEPNTIGLANVGLNARTTYYYKITSKKDGVESLASNVASTTTLSALGDTYNRPFQVGILQHGSFYEHLVNTADARYFSDYAGPNNQASADIFYKFTIQQLSEVEISTCKNPVTSPVLVDAYMHLLGSGGYHISSDDDNTEDNGCGESNPIIRLRLQPGDYYAVLEGLNANEGNAYMVIKVNPTPPNAFQNIIDAGDLTIGSQYLDTKNTNNYANQIGAVGKDVIYKFQLLAEAYFHGRVECCNGITQPWNSDPYMYLTNSNGQIIAERDNYDDSNSPYIIMKLEPGTYYAVAEGKGSGGNSLMNIRISEASSIDFLLADNAATSALASQQFFATPSPVTNVLSVIVAPNFEGEFVAVITELLSGRKVAAIRETPIDGKIAVNVSDLPSGIYIIKTSEGAYVRIAKQ